VHIILILFILLTLLLTEPWKIFC